EAARVLTGAGGVSLLAHPYSLGSDELIGEVLEVCDGLEALYAPYKPEQRARLLAISHHGRKIHSCGSDYHGYFTTDYTNPQFELPEPLADRLRIRTSSRKL
ncbi:MAG TPA: hypothetical protein VKR99_00690, partial [Candidatus Eremiobacteraceae bacterium]|nr:hypothetical protein [Candidatus Eremiobacteraceae bacterium]